MIKSLCEAAMLFFVLGVTGVAGLATPSVADDAKVPQTLLGLWAHSQADCRAKVSGQLDKGDRGNWQNTEYEFVAFCNNGMELPYQPVFCAADHVEASGSDYIFSGRCRIKDYPAAMLSFKIRAAGTSRVSFEEKDFSDSDFAITGDYVRCTPTYKCAGTLDGN